MSYTITNEEALVDYARWLLLGLVSSHEREWPDEVKQRIRQCCDPTVLHYRALEDMPQHVAETLGVPLYAKDGDVLTDE